MSEKDFKTLLAEHTIADEGRHQEVIKIFATINEKLDPMVENYKVTKTLGKWVLAILGFIAIIVSILLGVKNLLK